ncbi:NAD-dependent epimerase/dehydratase family protein [Pseudidiomarina sp. 1APP75-32.1]|uniref:NAD-dependent epimerase/dehydratase family protein n=1 Tax=Pseudidiomarina terrestris TaxID=2820060 RepID=A0AAW7R0N1_9GAMM|nr:MULTISPECIES: NAD-dependent epimerase/dehydratase family protein [unclassified Pseudidiomarina]MDN7124517.1 NAD-dependent epimerase/dehydratase family protein [Pseudidiomarina sp. 1APP75-32.1]MDN7129192.1 NAD-dependent epimerase/dehydratase family protein [Pseudidiomarina sp. 1APR75-15]
MNYLITGASGFIGRHLCLRLNSMSLDFTSISHTSFRSQEVTNIPNAEVVIHLAGKAHILNERGADLDSDYYEANCAYALEVARSAARNGLKRFVYVSSIGVYGKSHSKNPLTESAEVKPIESYAKSKLKAEIKLKKLSKELCFELVIVRPALVYGFDAPGNIKRLQKFVHSFPIIPFAERGNVRSFVYIENLIDFLILSATHKNAANQVFNVADDEPVSTYALISALSSGMRHRRLLFSLPRGMLKMILRVAGRNKMYEQLFGDLVLDISFAKSQLNWKPRYRTKEALSTAGKGYISNLRKDNK